MRNREIVERSLAAVWHPWSISTQTAVAMPHETAVVERTSLTANLGASEVLSPDGRMLALVATSAPGEPPQIYLRRLDQLQAAAMAGTAGASSPFFSPDGAWIGFFAGGKVKKVSVSGGAVVTLCDAPTPRGGWWGEVRGGCTWWDGAESGKGLGRRLGSWRGSGPGRRYSRGPYRTWSG